MFWNNKKPEKARASTERKTLEREVNEHNSGFIVEDNERDFWCAVFLATLKNNCAKHMAALAGVPNKELYLYSPMVEADRSVLELRKRTRRHIPFIDRSPG